MVWNKLKQQLESFINPALLGIVEYRPSGYRYLPDKSTHCYITVNKKEIFNMNDGTTMIHWYQTEQEIKNDTSIEMKVTPEEIESVRKESGDKIPEERLIIIAKSRKLAMYAKELMIAQTKLYKTDFQKVAVVFLADPIEINLKSDDIILNILAIIDRRVGKKRLQAMKSEMQMKHPIVKYFYELRMGNASKVK